MRLRSYSLKGSSWFPGLELDPLDSASALLVAVPFTLVLSCILFLKAQVKERISDWE